MSEFKNLSQIETLYNFVNTVVKTLLYYFNLFFKNKLFVSISKQTLTQSVSSFQKSICFLIFNLWLISLTFLSEYNCSAI
jgi:hypothetical protein